MLLGPRGLEALVPWGQVLLSETRTTSPNCMQAETKYSPTNYRASKAERF